MNTQNQLTTTDGPAGSLALDPRSAPSSYAMRAAEKLHPEYSLEWWMTVAHQSLQYQNLFCQARDERERIARIIDVEIQGILPNAADEQRRGKDSNHEKT